MAKLITETNFDGFKVQEKGKDLYLEGVFSSYGVKNNNKRTYPENVLKNAVNELQERMEKGVVFGELDHPQTPAMRLKEAAIQIESLRWQDNNLIGKAKVLTTPNGRIAREFIKNGQIGISSRGLGTVKKDGTVNEDFKLITWDLVAEPSNSSSWVNGVYEGKEFDPKTLNESDLVVSQNVLTWYDIWNAKVNNEEHKLVEMTKHTTFKENPFIHEWKKRLQEKFNGINEEKEEPKKERERLVPDENTLKKYADFPKTKIVKCLYDIEEDMKDVLGLMTDHTNLDEYITLMQLLNTLKELIENIRTQCPDEKGEE